jgi:type VI secretion system secreted protein Hcp
LIIGVTTGGSYCEDRLSETIMLNFAKVSVDYTPQVDGGAAGIAMPFGWDIAANSTD